MERWANGSLLAPEEELKIAMSVRKGFELMNINYDEIASHYGIQESKDNDTQTSED